MRRILIKNGKVWDGEKFLSADVYVEDGMVKSVSYSINTEADFVYDANGAIVSAGLIDSHVHIRGLSNASTGLPESVFAPFGVTAAVEAWAEKFDEGAVNGYGLKVLAFAGGWIQENRLITAGAEKVLASLKDRAVGLKVCFDSRDCEVRDITVVAQAVEFAEKHGLKVLVHCNRSPVPMMEIVKTLRKGDILTHPYHGGINSARDDNFACLQYAREKGVVLDSGFAGHIHTDFSVFQEALQKGCPPDSISTDLTLFSAFKRGGRYGLTACMSLAKLYGMDEETIFRAVTSTPANVYGKADEWGYLRKGRVADIAVIAYEDDAFDLTDENGNRVCWDKGYRCKLTIVNGDVVFKD